MTPPTSKQIEARNLGFARNWKAQAASKSPHVKAAAAAMTVADALKIYTPAYLKRAEAIENTHAEILKAVQGAK